MGATKPDGEPVIAFERELAPDEQIEDAAERVQIAWGPRLAAERLLGRPVLRRPDQHPDRGQGAAAACDPREAEVGRHHPPGLVLDQDVRWGQIAMHDTLRVRVSERLRDRCRIPRSLADVEGQARERRVGQVAAVDVLHHQERLLSIVHVVMHSDDVFVRKSGERSRLALEPAPLVRLGRDDRPEKFDRHVPAERAVMRPPNHPHSTLADQIEQPVAPCEHRHGLRCGHDSTPLGPVRSELYRGGLGAPGPVVLGDHDGVVVIPAAAGETILRLAEKKVSDEDFVRQKLAEGMSVSEAFRTYGVI